MVLGTLGLLRYDADEQSAQLSFLFENVAHWLSPEKAKSFNQYGNSRGRQLDD